MAELLLSLLLSIGGAVVGGIKGIQFVREGERAIMLRFDKAVKRRGTYKVIYPGLRLMIPFVHKLARIHVRQRTINFPNQSIVLQDRTVFGVSAVLLCRVKDGAQDLYNALFETTGINVALTDYGLMVIRDVLGDKNYVDLFGEGREQISEELFEKIQSRAHEWGVEIIKFELSDCSPTDETARLIQTSAQATFRVQALQEAAASLGLKGAQQLDPGLASVLIGAPLVASPTKGATTEIIFDKGE